MEVSGKIKGILKGIESNILSHSTCSGEINPALIIPTGILLCLVPCITNKMMLTFSPKLHQILLFGAKYGILMGCHTLLVSILECQDQHQN